MERVGNSRILRVPMTDGDFRSRVAAFRRALKRQISGADYGVVQFRDSWSGMPVLELRAQFKYKTIFDAARSPMAAPQILDLEMTRSLDRDQEACVLGADVVLVGTEPSRRYISARGRPDRVHVVPPGVDVDLFDWDEPAVDGPPRVLYLGAIEPGRGVRIVLRAAQAIVDKLPIKVTLAGPIAPNFDATLAREIEELKLEDTVEILGPVDHDDVPALISRATICVAPAAVELSPKPTGLFPTKILEYMACRRAVVASRRGTVSLLMKDKVHGLLFTPGDSADLAEKLTTLLRDADQRAELARRGYELVRESYTASATRRALRGVYESVAQMDGFRESSEVSNVARFDAHSLETMRDEVTDQEFIEELNVHDGVETAAITTQTGVGEDVTSVDVRAEPDTERKRPTDDKWGRADRLSTVLDTKKAEWDEKPRTGSTEFTPPWELTRDNDGTPVDVRRLPGNTPPPVETIFVAGEVDVPTPPPVPSDRQAVLSSARVMVADLSDGDSDPEAK